VTSTTYPGSTVSSIADATEVPAVAATIVYVTASATCVGVPASAPVTASSTSPVGSIGVTERTNYIHRVRQLAVAIARAWVGEPKDVRGKLDFSAAPAEPAQEGGPPHGA